MRIIIISLCLLLAACSTAQPVVIGCNPKLPPEPHYPYQDLTLADKHNYAKVVKAYVATVGLQHDYIGLQDKAIKGCE